MVGTLGPVVFEASADKVRTFFDMTRSGEAKYAEHDRIGQKGLLEFRGPGLDQVSFTMSFNVAFGVNPRREIESLRTLRDTGLAETLILAGEPLGDFVVLSIEETWRRIDNRGNLLVADAAVVVKEYVDGANDTG